MFIGRILENQEQKERRERLEEMFPPNETEIAFYKKLFEKYGDLLK